MKKLCCVGMILRTFEAVIKELQPVRATFAAVPVATALDRTAVGPELSLTPASVSSHWPREVPAQSENVASCLELTECFKIATTEPGTWLRLF